ncbi:hypothetical protein ACF0H5_001544 [Mactra antiquata]
MSYKSFDFVERSILIDSEETPSTLNKRLGKNVPVSKFKSSSARYLRAHPTFIRCLQEVIMKLLHQNIKVEIIRGFITENEAAAGSDVDKYLQSGCGAELKIRGTTGSVIDIASAVLQVCPVIIEREMRDLYVNVMNDRVHFHMSGPEIVGFKIEVENGVGISNPLQWAEDKINEGLEPSMDQIDCDNYGPLSSGDHYPSRFTHERVLGNIDVKITRNMTEFKRLVQYQGTNIVFDDSEGDAAWCGEPGITCPNACADEIPGNTVNQRCADRVMSPRLLTTLNKLQKITRTVLNDKLKVLEAWDETYEGMENGDSGDDLLHFEGRSIKVTVVSDDNSKLGTLSKYAVCIGADYVEHRGTYLYIAAKRYLPGGSKVLFPSTELLEVDVPVAQERSYKLPSTFSEQEKRKFPLFDSSGKLNAELSPGVTLRQFVSKSYRYFRLSPRIVECYNDIVYQENKHNKYRGGPKIEVEVLRGYLSNNENSVKFDVMNDKRFNRHNWGVAMQIRYKQNPNLPATHTPYRLFKTAIDKCAHRFYQHKQAMGIGLYADSIFVDVRPHFHLMKESMRHVPDDVDTSLFDDEITQRYLLARAGRIVNPENITSACLFQTKPQPLSHLFQHEHTEVIKRKRRRRATADDSTCVPTRYTQFCSSTEKHRKKAIDDIKRMVDQKPYQHLPFRSRKDVMEALNGCFGDCGTCLDGEIMESKIEHCNNFLHWVDFPVLNGQPDVTNVFVRSDTDDTTRIYACENGHDCVENAPLFSVVVEAVEKIYRPDPDKSDEAELYSVANNPSPVLALLEDIYTIQASGVVKFWVNDDRDMNALKRQLEVVMLYNRNVTLIKIYVIRYNVARDAVRGVVETAARSMVNSGCPDVTRETLTPYEILEVPEEKRKRSAEPRSVRHQVRAYHGNFEARWANQHILF